MFFPFGEQSGDFYELQYCRNKVTADEILKDIEFHKEDSLYIDSDEVKLFEDYYYKYFEHPVSPNGKFEFSPYGPNYYTKEQMKEILKKVKEDNPPEGKAFIYWLENAPSDSNGFYFLGI